MNEQTNKWIQEYREGPSTLLILYDQKQLCCSTSLHQNIPGPKICHMHCANLGQSYFSPHLCGHGEHCRMQRQVALLLWGFPAGTDHHHDIAQNVTMLQERPSWCPMNMLNHGNPKHKKGSEVRRSSAGKMISCSSFKSFTYLRISDKYLHGYAIYNSVGWKFHYSFVQFDCVTKKILIH